MRLISIALVCVFLLCLPLAAEFDPHDRMMQPNLENTLLTLPLSGKIRFLNDTEPYNSRLFLVRIEVIRSLGVKGNSRAVPVLCRTIQEGTSRIYRCDNRKLCYWKVRAASALALGRIGDIRAKDKLLAAAARDKEINVRISALRALGMLGIFDAKTVPAMIRELRRSG